MVEEPQVEAQRRFFCQVRAVDRESLSKIMNRDFDVFAPRAPDAHGAIVVDGILTLSEIEQLVNDGYPVLVEEDASRRARSSKPQSASSWIRSFKERQK